MKHLIFVGAGHAHLSPLSRARDFVAAGIRLTMIAPGKFWYSGMGPGMVSRFYEPRHDTVDVRALVEQGGGATMQYDALSLSVGSEAPAHAIAGAADFGVPDANLLASFCLASHFINSNRRSAIAHSESRRWHRPADARQIVLRGRWAFLRTGSIAVSCADSRGNAFSRATWMPWRKTTDLFLALEKIPRSRLSIRWSVLRCV